MADSQGRPLTTNVDIQSDVRADPPPEESSNEIIVLEDDADVPLQPHAYSKVGKIIQRIYSKNIKILVCRDCPSVHQKECIYSKLRCNHVRECITKWTTKYNM